MASNERWSEILTLLRRNGQVDTMDLVQDLYASESTIRRDLAQLENLGLLKRIHGGAILPESNTVEHSITYRYNANRKEKKAIAKLALPLINNHSSLFVDSSSTTGALCELLNHHIGLTLITNGVNNAKILTDQSNALVYVPGGIIHPKTNSILGNDALAFIKQFHCDFFIFSSSGIDLTTGITEVSHEQANIKKEMFKNAKTKILLFDHSKYGKSFLSVICKLEDIDYIITDEPLPIDISKYLFNQGVNIIYS